MLDLSAQQKQSLALAPQQLQGLALLAKSLPELRAEVIREIDANPALEDVDHPLETTMTDLESRRKREEAVRESDFPEDDFTPEARRYDEERLERRQAFFDNQVKTETLQEHLLAQLPLSDVAEADWPLAEVLIGDLDANGFHTGSLPDAEMAFGKTQSEIQAVLAAIMDLDPPGCGARTARECLRAQLDAIADVPLRAEVRRLIDGHLGEIADGTLDLAVWGKALAALRTLDPHPGRAFPSERDRIEYINPEVHAVKEDDGHWTAMTDKRSLPEIRISPKFEKLLSDPAQSEETKAYVRARLERARMFREAIARRQETVEAIAQAIFDRQQEFFTGGFAALKPLTESEVAKSVGVAATTVSRTVRDKYASTPQGTVELRRFFTSGVKASDGTTVSQATVLDALAKLIDAEDRTAPLSDEKLAALLKASGYPAARRTVAKYRDKLGIPGASARRA